MIRGTLVLTAALLISLGATLGAEDRDLLAFVKDLGATLEWDPLRDAGVISIKDDRIAIGVDTPDAIINYRMTVAIDAPFRRASVVWLTDKAVASINAALQNDRLANSTGHLRVAYILLDPGHGGADSGGVGKFTLDGKTVMLAERDVVIKVAHQLSTLLKAAYPDKQILITRENDYVSLEQRAAFANSILAKTNDAVLFISIHANTTPFNRDASGFEVWCLPPQYTRQLVDPSTVAKDSADIVPILNSIQEDEVSVESTLLARDVLNGLETSIGKLSPNRGLKEEPWYVVRNTKMPAILVEIGFVTNPAEAARLSQDSYLKQVAEGIYNGIRSSISRFERNGSAGAE